MNDTQKAEIRRRLQAILQRLHPVLKWEVLDDPALELTEKDKAAYKRMTGFDYLPDNDGLVIRTTLSVNPPNKPENAIITIAHHSYTAFFDLSHSVINKMCETIREEIGFAIIN